MIIGILKYVRCADREATSDAREGVENLYLGGYCVERDAAVQMICGKIKATPRNRDSLGAD
jgi:hypothetical protein